MSEFAASWDSIKTNHLMRKRPCSGTAIKRRTKRIAKAIPARADSKRICFVLLLLGKVVAESVALIIVGLSITHVGHGIRPLIHLIRLLGDRRGVEIKQILLLLPASHLTAHFLFFRPSVRLAQPNRLLKVVLAEIW